MQPESPSVLIQACGRYIGILEHATVALTALHFAGVYGDTAIRAAAAAAAVNAEDYNRTHFSRHSAHLSVHDLRTWSERQTVVANLKALSMAEVSA